MTGPRDRPIRILVNATSARVGGGLSFLTRQLREYAQHHGEDHLTILAAPWNHERLAEATGLAIELVPVESTADRIRFEQLGLPTRARAPARERDQVEIFDVLYNPANLAPIRPFGVPSVLMLQNLAYFGAGPSFASHRAPLERVKRRLVRASVRRCDALICPSQALADAVVTDHPRAKSKLHVIRPGPFDSTPGSGSDAVTDAADLARDLAAAKKVLQTHLEGRGYVLCVANYYDYKRLDDVVAAWAIADAEGFDHDLLVVGSVPTEVLMELRARAPKGRRHRIHYHGVVRAPDELRAAYRGAAAVVCLSALESLSLVPVEAAALGIPTVLSNIAAHREFSESQGQYRVPVAAPQAAARALVQAVSGPRPEPVNLLSDWATHTRALHAVFRSLLTRS